MNYMDRTLFYRVTKESEMPVLVAFCASDCGYCRRITPALKRLADRYRGTMGVGVLDIFMEPELGYKEFKTAAKVKKVFDELGIDW